MMRMRLTRTSPAHSSTRRTASHGSRDAGTGTGAVVGEVADGSAAVIQRLLSRRRGRCRAGAEAIGRAGRAKRLRLRSLPEILGQWRPTREAAHVDELLVVLQDV